MMTKTRLALLALLFLAAPFLARAAGEPPLSSPLAHPAGTVVSCFDGDTLKLSDRRIVRLAGLDAPEVSHKDKKAQYYSKQAKIILENLTRGRLVELEFPGVSSKDNYGRLICNLILPDGRSLNEELVSQGAAFFYPHRDLNPQFQDKLLELQTDAINERRGMWDKILSSPVSAKPYVGNQQSMRFFPADCPEAETIKPRNRVNFGTLMDAFMAGYAPARVCPFWPLEDDVALQRGLNGLTQ